MRHASALVFAIVALGCGSEDETRCYELDTVRCDDSERARLRCDDVEGQLRWVRSECEAPTSTCAERGVRDATCVGEAVGQCDADAFADRCVDEHTLESCARLRTTEPEGVRHRIVCGDNLVCAPARGGVDGCVPRRLRNSPPALVAFVRGEVALVEEGESRAAPPIPFRVMPNARLRVGAQALAIVIVKERASRIEGPAEIDPYTLQPEGGAPSPEAQAILEMLAEDAPEPVPPEEPLIRPAPNADSTIAIFLGAGAPGAIENLREVAWRCDAERACGQTVTLEDRGTTLWRAQAERRVAYAGPQLEPGHTYTLRVGPRSYRLLTRRAVRWPRLYAALRQWPLDQRVAVFAALYRWSGSRAAAVESIRRARPHIDGPDLAALRSAYGVGEAR